MRPFNENALTFIRTAASELLKTEHKVNIFKKQSRTEAKATNAPPQILKTLIQPRVFNHYVMNLPATAVTFLPSFVGLYNESERKELPADLKLPMIHVYCFSTKSDDNVQEGIKICQEISKQLNYEVTPQTPELTIHDVRDVAPNKRMFRASFRLPEEVAFRAR